MRVINPRKHRERERERERESTDLESLWSSAEEGILAPRLKKGNRFGILKIGD